VHAVPTPKNNRISLVKCLVTSLTSVRQDVRRQLYGDEDDRKFFQWVQSQLKQTEKRLEDGRAVLHHLEAQLINVACDDPGAAIGAQLALPLLQERLDAKAQDFARQKAAQAEEDIIKMEVGQVVNAVTVV